jgi:hypothetical protein
MNIGLGFALHDATLLTVTYEWAESGVVIKLRSGHDGIVSVMGAGVTLLELPHRNPWGRSVSVNEVRGPSPLADGRERLEIEMQSGDTLLIEGTGFSARKQAE